MGVRLSAWYNPARWVEEKAWLTCDSRYFWPKLADVDSAHQIWDPQSVSAQGKEYVIDLARLQGCAQKGVSALEGYAQPWPSSRKQTLGFGIKQIQVSIPSRVSGFIL